MSLWDAALERFDRPAPEPRPVPHVDPSDIYDPDECVCGHDDGDDLAVCQTNCWWCVDAQRQALVVALNAIDRYLWAVDTGRVWQTDKTRNGDATADLRDAGNHIGIHPI